MTERRVLWASTAGPGGIHDQLRAVQDSPVWRDWNMRHIPTHRAGSVVGKITVFACGTAKLAAALCLRPALVHLHTVAKRGSFLRNTMLAWLVRLAGVPAVLHVHGRDFEMFYADSPHLVRALIRAALSGVDAVAVDEGQSAAMVSAVAPHRRTVVVKDTAELDALYRTVSDPKRSHRADPEGPTR